MAKLYSCDACGNIIGQDKEKVSHLNVMFNYPYEKVGTRHLCKECKIKFIAWFNGFIRHYKPKRKEATK